MDGEGPDSIAPTVSVVVPAHNASATLRDALESIRVQTYPPLEVIVVDDGSTDDTAHIAASFGPPVRVISKTNGGTASARNAGVAEASGDIVAFLDADDVYTTTHLNEIASLLRDRADLAAVATDAEMRSPSRKWRNGSFWPRHAGRDPMDISSPIIFCALGVRRDVLRSLGEFDGRFHILEDVEMHHRLLCSGHRVAYVDSASYIYNVHDQSKSQSGREARGRMELFRINARYALSRRTPMRFRARLAVRALRHAIAAARAAAK